MGQRFIARRPMPDLVLSDAEAGYLAGLIDGEGSFSLYPTRNGRAMNVSLTISNTDIRLLNWCSERSRVGALVQQRARTVKPRHRTQYVWCVNARNDLRALLPRVIPFLIGKAEQAKVLLQYCEDRAAGIPFDLTLYEGVVSRLNQRTAA